jgi:hypothetical protein
MWRKLNRSGCRVLDTDRGNYIRFLFAFNYVIDDAKCVPKMKRSLVLAENDATVFEQEPSGRSNVLDGKSRNRRLRVQVTVYAETKVSRIVFETSLRFGQQAELHHVGVEVLRCGDVFEVDGDTVIRSKHLDTCLLMFDVSFGYLAVRSSHVRQIASAQPKVLMRC